MKEPVGGNKQLVLDNGVNYTFSDLKTAAVKIMKTNENKNFFEGSKIEIDNFREEIYVQIRQTVTVFVSQTGKNFF